MSTHTHSTTLYLAGGGTGGHIYPNLAIADKIKQQFPQISIHFIISNRDIDTQILNETDYAYTTIPVRPMTKKPLQIPGFLKAWRGSIKTCKKLFRNSNQNIILTTGGFVAGPPITAAYQLRKKTTKQNNHRILVNLDAVPGIANQSQHKKSTHTFSVYPVKNWGNTNPITLPQEPMPTPTPTKEQARKSLNLNPDLKTLLITGGSQGASSINQAITKLFQNIDIEIAFSGWQILHITGPTTFDLIEPQYKSIGLPHQVIPYCNDMQSAWLASDLAITRAGAGTVAQASHYRVPTIFLPYPYHRDNHQRLNALPLAENKACVLLEDTKSPELNAEMLLPLLLEFGQSPDRLNSMQNALAKPIATDGVSAITAYIQSLLTT